MRIGMIADRVSFSQDPLHQRWMSLRTLTHQKKRGMPLILSKLIKEKRGAVRVRAIIECQRNPFLRRGRQAKEDAMPPGRMFDARADRSNSPLPHRLENGMTRHFLNPAC